MIQVGYRVLWMNEVQEVKAQVLRIFKEKAQILTADLEKITVPLDELEIAPLPGKKLKPVETFDSVSLPSTSPDTESSALSTQPHDSVSPLKAGNDTESLSGEVEGHDSVSTIDGDTESPYFWSRESDRRYKPRGTARGKNNYFRFSYRDGGKMRHIHIPGGNTNSPLAQQHWEEVRQMVQQQQPTQYIVEVINRWRS